MLSRPIRSTRVSRRAGSALVAGLGVVALLAVLSVTYLQATLSRSSEGAVAADSKRAFYIAEAGLSEAYQGLRIGKSGNVGSDLIPARFGDGVFWVVAEHVGSGRLQLKSTGLCGRGRSALSVVVENTGGSVAALGVFTGQSMTVRTGCLVDSFDSRVGTYAEQEAGSDARVGSNADVTVQGTRAAPTTIRGDVVPGNGSTVTRTANTTITGSTAPRTEAEQLPPVAIPDIDSEGTLTHANPQKALEIPGGDHAWTAVNIKQNTSAVIYGPARIVADTFHVESGATLTMDATGGPIALYAKQTLELASGSTISTPAAAPEGVTLLVDGESGADVDHNGVADVPLVLNASGAFYGTVYAPRADVTLQQPFELFGAVSARSLVLAENTPVHFDRALAGSAPGSSDLPRTLCWRVMDLPPVPLVRQRRDPLVALRRLGVTPIDACDAHYDIGAPPPSTDPNVTPFAGGLVGAGKVTPALETGPLSDAGLAAVAVLDQVPALPSNTLRDDLIARSPLETAVLMRAILRRPALASADLRDVMYANDPMPPEVLMKVIDLTAPLSDQDRLDVLLASSPLPARIHTILLAQTPAPLPAPMMATLLAAQ